MSQAVAVKQRGQQEEVTIRRIQIQKPEAQVAPPHKKKEGEVSPLKLDKAFYGMLIFSFVFSGSAILLFFLSIF